MENNELLRKIEQLEQKIKKMEEDGSSGFLRRAFSKTSILVGVTFAALVTGILLYATQITFTDGTVISANEVNNNFNELYAENASLEARLNCRSSFWQLSDGRLCMESTPRAAASMPVAQQTCSAVSPGCRVCTYSDFKIACGNGHTPIINGGWFGDHVGDDQYLYMNQNYCGDNIDGMGAFGDSRQYRCCY